MIEAKRYFALNAIVAITNAPACYIDLINGDSGGGPGFSSPAAMAGYPHLTVPMGQVYGLPVGLSFVGGPYKEAQLLTVAYAYEQASRKRVAPQFKAPFVGSRVAYKNRIAHRIGGLFCF